MADSASYIIVEKGKKRKRIYCGQGSISDWKDRVEEKNSRSNYFVTEIRVVRLGYNVDIGRNRVLLNTKELFYVTCNSKSEETKGEAIFIDETTLPILEQIVRDVRVSLKKNS